MVLLVVVASVATSSAVSIGTVYKENCTVELMEVNLVVKMHVALY